jgi:hypothetical protein
VHRRGRHSLYVPLAYTKRRQRKGRRMSALQAVRLLLPRRLQAQVGAQLDTLELKDALAELKSYKNPPENVKRVLMGVLCLLGRRLRTLGDWQKQVLPHLRRELQREMLDFDPVKSQAEQTCWVESRTATEGLTSDEIQSKGSLAVKTMLKWLEVQRLMRHDAVSKAVKTLGLETHNP